MEFVLGNIYKFAYGNGVKENPEEELGIGKLDRFIYDNSNKLVGLHFVDRYGPRVKRPTNISYYDSYGIEYTEALNEEPIPREVLEDYYKWFPQNNNSSIIETEEEKIDKGILDFNKHLEQFSFISNFMNVFYPKIKKDYAELKEKYENLQEDYIDLEERCDKIKHKLEIIKTALEEDEI